MATGAQLKQLVQEQPPSGKELKALSDRGKFGPAAETASDFGTQFAAGVAGLGETVNQGLTNISPLGVPRALGFETPTLADITSAITGAPTPTEVQESAGAPDTLAGASGRFAGTVAGIAPGIGGAAGLVSRSPATGGNLLQRLGRGIRNLTAGTGETFAKRPGAMTAAETGLGATAGAGGFVAAEKFPDSESAQVIGELLGGTLPALAPTGLAVRAGTGIVNRARRPFTGSGGEQRGTQRIQELVDAEPTIESLNRPTTIDPQTGQPVLTPSQRSGDIGALSLEKAVSESSNELKRGADEQIARANQVLQEGAADIGASPVDAAQEYLSNLMKTRLRIAAQRADERIANLGKGSNREQANRIAQEEIEKAMKAGREQERQLFRAIPEETPVPLQSGREAFEQSLSEVGEAQASDIPGIVKRLLDPESKQFLGEVTTIKEIRSLQSRLRQTARNARASGAGQNLNKARIADNIADSLTDDLAKAQGAPEIADDIAKAVGFSRELNQSFKQGTVGRLLGRDALGGDRVAGSLSLESTIAGGGPKSREAFDQIVTALDNPNLPGGSEGFRTAASDFIRQQFIKKAAPGGQLNANTAQTFIRNNEELLNRLPNVRQELEQATRAGQLTDEFRQRITNPKASKAALFIQKDPQTAFRDIANQTPSRASRDIQNLINMAKKDETGVALQGLKSGFVDFLFSGAREGQRDVAGQQFVSGFKLRDAMDNRSNRAVISRLFNQEEKKRLNTIMDDFVALDKARATGEALDGILEDAPGKFAQRIAGVFGAAIGRNAARVSGSGGTVQIPGQFADTARDLARAGVKDPAVQFVKDAIQDETLFREVLQRGFKDGQLTPKATRRLNAWMAGILAERGADQEEPTR